MAIEKPTLGQLQRFSAAFKEARERGANEADTVMFIVKFFEELLGYDSLRGRSPRNSPSKTATATLL